MFNLIFWSLIGAATGCMAIAVMTYIRPGLSSQTLWDWFNPFSVIFYIVIGASVLFGFWVSRAMALRGASKIKPARWLVILNLVFFVLVVIEMIIDGAPYAIEFSGGQWQKGGRFGGWKTVSAAEGRELLWMNIRFLFSVLAIVIISTAAVVYPLTQLWRKPRIKCR